MYILYTYMGVIGARVQLELFNFRAISTHIFPLRWYNKNATKKKQIMYWKFELEQWIVDEIIMYSIWHTMKEEVKQYMLVVKSGSSMWKELKNIYWEEKEKKKKNK